ncbi:MAG: NIPSNAP family protein [Dehalococcoidia bacterium]
MYTLRTFQVDRTNYRRFVELSEDGVWPALEHRDGRALGLWQVVIGGPERIVLMTRYESLEHWEGTRGWQGAAQRGAPPDDVARRGREAGVERSAMTLDTTLIALNLISRREPPENAPEAAPGIYTLRSFSVHPRDDAAFVRLTESVIWPWFETMGTRHLGVWRTSVAEDPRIYMLSRYDDLAHWEATRAAGPEPADSALRGRWQAAREALRDRAQLTQGSGMRVLRPISRRRP